VGYEGGGGSVNVQGEEQKKLDVVTNDVLKAALKFTGKVTAANTSSAAAFCRVACFVGGRGRQRQANRRINAPYRGEQKAGG
jgi:hypothetical protein